MQKKDRAFSSNDSLRFKAADVLEMDIADVLQLPLDEVCNETGGKNCIQEVHVIALGGVDAYNGGSTTPIQESMITTPIVWDRILLSACGRRAALDLQAADGIIFKNFSLDEKSNLSDPKSPAATNAIKVLYKRALKREATEGEVSNILAFYAEVAKTKTENAANEWAKLSCYVVLSSLEFVFY